MVRATATARVSVTVTVIIIIIINDNLYSAVCTRSTSRALHNKHKKSI